MAASWFNNAGQAVFCKIQENPKTTRRIVTGAVVAPVAALLAPVALTAVGFGAAGPVAGSLATVWQASIGNVVAGSSFAFLQAAGMGGGAAGVLGWVAAGVGAVAGAAAATATESARDEAGVSAVVNNGPDDDEGREGEDDEKKEIEVGIEDGVLKEINTGGDLKVEIR